LAMANLFIGFDRHLFVVPFVVVIVVIVVTCKCTGVVGALKGFCGRICL